MNSTNMKDLIAKNDARRAEQSSSFGNIELNAPESFKFNQETKATDIPEVSGLGNNEYLNEMSLRQKETNRLNNLNGDTIDTIYDGTPNEDVYKAIANVESTNSYTAKNPKSSAYGKYQFLDATYKNASKALNIPVAELRTPNGQETAMKWLVDENTAELKRRKINPTALNLYGIHQQGGSVYAKMLNGGKMNKKELNTINNNIPKKHRTGNPIQDWMNYYGGRFAKSKQPVSIPEPVTQIALPSVAPAEFLAKEKALLYGGL